MASATDTEGHFAGDYRFHGLNNTFHVLFNNAVLITCNFPADFLIAYSFLAVVNRGIKQAPVFLFIISVMTA
jgi:hypothetical protein